MSAAANSVVQAVATGVNPPLHAPFLTAALPVSVALPTHVLKIELHPAELGAVAASLRLSGEQLSVELKPETVEAYRRLSADADSIAQSLKRLGLAVDSVSVIQPQIAASGAARADAASTLSAAMAERDNSQSQPGTFGGGGGRPGEQQSGRNDGPEKTLEQPAPIHGKRTGGSLFI